MSHHSCSVGLKYSAQQSPGYKNSDIHISVSPKTLSYQGDLNHLRVSQNGDKVDNGSKIGIQGNPIHVPS